MKFPALGPTFLSGQPILRATLFHGLWLGLIYGAVALTLGLWEHGLRLPFLYEWDSVFYAMVAKMGSLAWWKEAAIGWPAGLNLADHPDNDLVQWVPLKLLALATRDPFFACNLWFLAGFGLCYGTAYYSLRVFSMGRWPAALAAALFAVLPYHFHRGMIHLFLGAYMAVPFLLPLADWVLGGKHTQGRRIGWAMVLAIPLSTSIYYGLFALVGMGLLVLWDSFSGFQWGRVRRFALVALVILGGLLVNLAPWVYGQWSGRGNAEVSARSFTEADPLGLRLAQLVLPGAGHRIPALAAIGQKVHDQFRPALETEWSNLGFFGALGFGLLVVVLLLPGRGADTRLHFLSRFQMGLVLFATAGGGGFLFGLLVHPVLRAQNRVSVILGFFALSGLFMALDGWEKLKAHRRFFPLAAILIFALGAWEQTSTGFRLDTDRIQGQVDLARGMVRKIEDRYPAATTREIRLFQLPFVPFPEYPPVGRMKDYEHLKAYLHSERIAVSYGVMRGRGDDLFPKVVAALPPDEMARECARRGFHGIWIDGRGLADGGASLDGAFSRVKGLSLLHMETMEGNLIFVDVTGVSNWGISREVETIPDAEVSFGRDGKGFRLLASGWEWTDQGARPLSETAVLRFRIPMPGKFLVGFHVKTSTGAPLIEPLSIGGQDYLPGPDGWFDISVDGGSPVDLHWAQASRGSSAQGPRLLLDRMRVPTPRVGSPR